MIYACFCEVDHDVAGPELWCYPCRRAHGYVTAAERDDVEGGENARRPWED